ncbi:MAG: hypothetical protein ABL876_01135 [Chitinophagaceae bacterium]
MNDIEEIKIKLKEFILADKFEKYQELQPAVENSTEEDKKFVNDEMNACCTNLLNHLEQKKPSDKALKKIVRNSLEKIKSSILDTEDEEFCYELYFILGDILGIDIEDKAITPEQMYMQPLQKIAKAGGIDLNKLIPPNNSTDKA